MRDADARRIAVRVVSVAAAAVGGMLGYDAGDQISGTLLAVVMAVNAAVFGALLGGAGAEWIFRSGSRERRPD